MVWGKKVRAFKIAPNKKLEGQMICDVSIGCNLVSKHPKRANWTHFPRKKHVFFVHTPNFTFNANAAMISCAPRNARKMKIKVFLFSVYVYDGEIDVPEDVQELHVQLAPKVELQAHLRVHFQVKNFRNQWSPVDTLARLVS